jgi:hypothetical protein
VDLAAPQVEVDRVVRGEGPEALGDAAELEGELRGVTVLAGAVRR